MNTISNKLLGLEMEKGCFVYSRSSLLFYNMRRRIRNDQPIQLQANPFQSISNNQTNSNKNKLYSTTAYSTRIKISEKNKTKPKKNI